MLLVSPLSPPYLPSYVVGNPGVVGGPNLSCLPWEADIIQFFNFLMQDPRRLVGACCPAHILFPVNVGDERHKSAFPFFRDDPGSISFPLEVMCVSKISSVE